MYIRWLKLPLTQPPLDHESKIGAFLLFSFCPPLQIIDFYGEKATMYASSELSYVVADGKFTSDLKSQDLCVFAPNTYVTLLICRGIRVCTVQYHATPNRRGAQLFDVLWQTSSTY